MPHLDHDRLVQLGMYDARRSSGEVEHLGRCRDCWDSLTEIASTVRLVAPNGRWVRSAEPPDGMWERIVERTGDQLGDRPVSDNSNRGGRPRAARSIVAAAAVIGCVFGAGVTAVVVSTGSNSGTVVARPEMVATALLSVPEGRGKAFGKATLVNENGRWTLLVDTRGLTSRGGYFEVWLLDGTGRMYALGALSEGSTARLAVPDGISIAQFNVVDISVQRFDGDPSHSRDSVLRGILRA